MKGRVPTFDPLYHIPSLLMARKYLSLFKKPQNDSARTIIAVRFFGPLRVSESQSTTMKAAKVEKSYRIGQPSSQLKLCLDFIWIGSYGFNPVKINFTKFRPKRR